MQPDHLHKPSSFKESITMKEYQVFIETKGKFIAEVIAKDEEEAIELARGIWNDTSFHNLTDVEDCGKIVAIPLTD